LAENKISAGVVSTHNKDYFLIKKSKSDKGGAGPSNKDNKQKPKYNSFSMLNQGVQRHSLMQRPTLIQNQNKKPVGIPLPPTP